MSTVRIEHDGPVTIVTIDRPEVRNAVDRATADALADAFRAFDADDDRDVAVLTGAGGAFCAGADLKAISSGGGNRAAPDGDGPMGPSRMLLDKPVVAAVCHGGVINVFLAALLGLERHLWFEPGYTSISRVAAARTGERSLVTLNETAHLVATFDVREEPV